MNLSHVRAECPSCVSVESVQTVGIQMCGASDEHDVEFEGDGQVHQCRSDQALRSSPTII